MAKKIATVGIRKEAGFVYFVDEKGDIYDQKSDGSGVKRLLVRVGLKKQTDYFYYIDEQGDVSCCPYDEISKEAPDVRKEFDLIIGGREDRYRQRVEKEERAKLKEKRLRNEIRRKLLEEEFKDMTTESREPIPTEVRHEVWQRDKGRCVKCESRENLEFDHIIPISKGGSNTVRNIELLCESCNRQKSANIQ